jgi:NADH-ubiquinone oxidoreductase chain 4
MIKIFFTLIFRFFFMIYNIRLIFCVSLRCLVTYLIFIYYVISNGDYIIIIRLYIGIDKYSFYIIILSVWIIGLIYLSLFFDDESEIILKIIIFNFIIIVLILFFGSLNLLLIYLFFEIRLIPTFIIVFYWGNNLERLRASFYLLMYIMFISLPLLIYIFKLYFFNYNLRINLITLDWLNFYKLGGWDFLIMFGAFFIKLPIYLFHVWLPKAHVLYVRLLQRLS